MASFTVDVVFLVFVLLVLPIAIGGWLIRKTEWRLHRSRMTTTVNEAGPRPIRLDPQAASPQTPPSALDAPSAGQTPDPD